jgi:aspartate carbamoyltransferase catalytic subunit
MTATPLPRPDAGRCLQQHPAAAPERARLLLDSIPEEPGVLGRLRGCHVASIRDFDAPLLRQLIRLAARYELGELAGTHPMRCRVLANLYLDHSQCTGRLAFNVAWLRLGGNLVDFEGTLDRILSRRYAPDEVANLCSGYADLAVLRTGDAETFADMLPRFGIPVVNAGDGPNEHPTHAMADMYMLAKWRPGLFLEDAPVQGRLQIAIIGDPSRTRTVRSLLRLLSTFPHAVERVVLMQRLARPFNAGQREELEQAGLRVETVDELYPNATGMEIVHDLLPSVDLLYADQMQTTHVSRMSVAEGISLLKPEAMVLSPELQNDEAANRLNDSPHNGYFAQARGSVFVRMALFTAIGA